MSTSSLRLALPLALGLGAGPTVEAPALPVGRVAAALGRSGPNRAELEDALRRVPPAQAGSLRYLLAHAPQRDLRELSAEFLLENVAEAHAAFDTAPWRGRVPRAVFLDAVLPHASVNEPRERWRPVLRARLSPFVADASTPGEAAARLNRTIWNLLGVRYSTQRTRADQGPLETVAAGTASCTGLSILLVDACRAVGVPARFVGTPLWSDGSGNHSWVEIWDDGWHFTGAAEPTGDRLDRAWFTHRAAAAVRDDPRHAIYAASYRRTPLSFPLAWAAAVDWVPAVNVTDRYAGASEPLPEGQVLVRFRVRDGASGRRVAARLTVTDEAGRVVAEGRTRDEGFDANDHLSLALPLGGRLEVEARLGERRRTRQLAVGPGEALIDLEL